MSRERWDRLNEIFHAAAGLSPAARESYLAAACGGDAALRVEVDRLLAAHDRAGRFIELPALAHGDVLPEPEGSSPIGRRFGPWCVVREIGRGGMGAVYLAERADGQFAQRVALKLVKRGMDTDVVLRQFRAERQILASLDHPNIARLLDGGTTDDGRPYFVMEYVDGRPIDAFADEAHLGVRERLELFLPVCAAVSYAHRQHVIHRDIKPANIFVTPEGVPKLLDFGIAKVLHVDSDDPTTSVTGLRLLTPEYASPEQVIGERATEVSDVYSLGVVLYELLAGRSPYRPRSREPLDVIEAVRTTDPARPSTVDAGGMTPERRRALRGDLDTIVLTALRKEPARRYGSVALFAEDLRRHLDGLPVRARPDRWTYRAGKFIGRHRATVGAGVLLLLALVIAGVGMAAYRAAGAEERNVPGVLAASDRVLVADFADQAGDPTLAAAVTDAFRVDLAQSPFIRVLTQRQVRTALTQMQKAPDVALDDSLAREVAVRQGAKAILTGSVTRVSGRYAISAQLIGAAGGDLLAAVRETADSTEVIRALDRLTGELRVRMGESLRAVRGTPPLEQVTTPSLAALRAYTEGVRTINGGDRSAGLALLDSAVRIDTGFASAYRVMAVTLGDMVEYGREFTAMDHALANQARLPFYERYHFLANYAYTVREDYDAAVDAYTRLLERYPDDVRALNNLGYVYHLRREYDRSDSALERALAVDSTIATIQLGIVIARINAGRFDAARQALDRAEAAFPKRLNTKLSEIYLASAQQDWENAERHARERLVTWADDTLDQLDGKETLAGILLTRGRLAEAERVSREVIALSPRLQSMTRYYSSMLRLARLESVFRGDRAHAIALVDSALTRFPLDSVPEGDRPYDELARFFASVGQVARARELAAAAERTSLGRRRGVDAERHWTLGTIALAEGRRAEAQAQLRDAQRGLVCGICALPDLARSYDAAAMGDSAVAVYERYVTTPWEWRFETDGVELGRALLRLGELHEQQGDPAKARDAYARVSLLWSRADAELQPLVAQARRRLEALQPDRPRS